MYYKIHSKIYHFSQRLIQFRVFWQCNQKGVIQSRKFMWLKATMHHNVVGKHTTWHARLWSDSTWHEIATFTSNSYFELWSSIPQVHDRQLNSGHATHGIPDSKAHGANMGPIWGRQDPGGPQVGPMNFAIWDVLNKFGPEQNGNHFADVISKYIF